MIVTGISKEDYPKGNNVRYDSSYNPQIQLSIL